MFLDLFGGLLVFVAMLAFFPWLLCRLHPPMMHKIIGWLLMLCMIVPAIVLSSHVQATTETIRNRTAHLRRIFTLVAKAENATVQFLEDTAVTRNAARYVSTELERIVAESNVHSIGQSWVSVRGVPVCAGIYFEKGRCKCCVSAWMLAASLSFAYAVYGRYLSAPAR